MATVSKDFSIEDKLKAVITLQKIDSKNDELKILKGELPMEVNDLEDEVEGLNTRINNIDSTIESINEYIKSRENAKKEAEALIKKYEVKQDQVKNNREFEAISKEIENQELEIRLCDKHIKDAKFQIQENQVLLNQAEEAIQIKNEILEGKRTELNRIIKETEKEEKEYLESSEKAKEKVDDRLLTAYQRIRQNYRNGLAVVPILRDSCGGCFNIIPPQRQAEIHQHKKIIVCEHCGRILVDNELHESINI